MKTAVVILPGRGTYNKAELGVLQRTFPNPDLLAAFDAYRTDAGQETLSALDGADRFSMTRQGRGDNAAPLIYAASLGDALNIDTDAIDIVAVTGNSMGWYTALACAGAVDAIEGLRIANTMGRWMHEDGAGGQLVYPHMGPDWTADPTRKAELLGLVDRIDAGNGQTLSLSINLGGQLVLAGNTAGLAAFEEAVPKQDRFPLRLPGHVGFHSDLVAPVSKRALQHFDTSLFAQPQRPMIDGRGHIWWPGASDTAALKDYTFGHQVTKPYDFTRAVEVAAKEFAPDLFIVTGPGNTLGGAVAQSLIHAEWRALRSKSEFQASQSTEPVMVSMGLPDQRKMVT